MKALRAVFATPAFASRDFRRLSIDAICFATGSGGELVVLGLLVLEITGSSAYVGTALALYYGPLLFVGGPAGALADWLPRRTLLRIIELAIGANFLIVGLLVAASRLELWHVLVIATVSGSIRATYQPVRLSFAYDLVGREHAVAGLSVLQIGNRLGQGLGGLLAGVAMARFGPEHAYLTLASIQLVAVLVLGRIGVSGGVASSLRTGIGRTFADYGGELTRNARLATLVIITMGVNLFGFSFLTALPELATVHLGGDAEDLGLLHVSRAVGGTAAALALTVWGARIRQGFLYAVVIHLFAAGMLALALAPDLVTALGVILVISACASLTDVISQSMMQRAVPDHLRGRAMGAWMIAIGVSPLGQLEMGALIAALGVEVALALNGVVLAACAIAAILVGRLDRFDTAGAGR